METKIKVGDTVRLQQGGSNMTVSYVENGKILCTWFQGGESKKATYPENTLTKVD